MAREECDGGREHPGKSGPQFPQLPKTVFRILNSSSPNDRRPAATQAFCFRSVCDLTIFTTHFYRRLLGRTQLVCNIQAFV